MADVLVVFLQWASVAFLLLGAILSLVHWGRSDAPKHHMFDDSGPFMSMRRSDFPGNIDKPPLRALQDGAQIAPAVANSAIALDGGKNALKIPISAPDRAALPEMPEVRV
jgi:hypothetical protein